MKCILCGKRKGKRQCPAKGALICAQCCGEKRMVEFRCPPCPYLADSVDYEIRKKVETQMLQAKNPERLRRFHDVLGRLGHSVAFLERKIVTYAGSLRSLTDREVREAIGLCEKNCKSAASGVIYRHSSNNALADDLSKQLMTAAEVAEAESGMARLTTSELSDCFFALGFDAEYYRQESTDSRAYLRYLARIHSDVGDATENEPLIRL